MKTFFLSQVLCLLLFPVCRVFGEDLTIDSSSITQCGSDDNRKVTLDSITGTNLNFGSTASVQIGGENGLE